MEESNLLNIRVPSNGRFDLSLHPTYHSLCLVHSTVFFVKLLSILITINKGHSEMKTTISEMKNTLDIINGRLDEVKDRNCHLEYKVEGGKRTKEFLK